MKYSVIAPQGWRMDLTDVKDPVQAYETMSTFAKTAEQLHYECVWLYDHFHTVPTPTQEVTFECWTSTAALARDTKTIRIGQIVTCNSYRNPALLAKMASTVDVLSNGRLNFGIGAGWYEHEYLAYGYEFPDAPTRLKQLGEAVQIIKSMWTEEQAIFEGNYYSVRGAINQPKGVQMPHIPLLIAGGGERVTLKLVTKYADACNIIGLEPENIARKFNIILEHCKNVGRDYNSIHKTILMNCSIDDDENIAFERAKAANYARNAGGEEFIKTKSLVGTPQQIADRLKEYEAVGVQEVILYFPQEKRTEQLHMFAEKIMNKE
jgi:F420-dependent oxidoreductase-like protein